MSALSKNQLHLSQLRKEQLQAFSSYYLDDSPLLTDEQYDDLCCQLLASEVPNSQSREWFSENVWVVSNRNTPFTSGLHQIPMLSLTNLYNLEELKAWYLGLQKLLPQASLSYLCQLKLDGVAVSLRYQKGVLTQALTRGDGQQGEDITRNIKTVSDVPYRLKQPVDIEVRGEICYPFKAFAKENSLRESQGQELMKNPRNAVAGLMLTLDSTIASHHNLKMCVFELITKTDVPSSNQHSDDLSALQWLKELGLPIKEDIRETNSISVLEDFYNYCLTSRHNLELPIDGVVVKLNSLQQRDQVGSTLKSPRWAVALKFPAEKACTILKGVELNVGRTGRINPTAILKPVQLDGTTVARATLHNFDQIERLQLCIGVQVQVEKGGDIIPKVVGLAPTKIAASSNAPAETNIPPPDYCPSCHTPLKRHTGEVDYYCLNPLCPQQYAERLLHFVSRPAMNIEELGPAIINQLLNKQWVSAWADIYDPTCLNQDKLASLENMGEKSAQLVMENIECSKSVPLHRFLHAVGIRYVGARTSQILAEVFGSLEAVQDASLEQLLDIPAIGEVMAESIRAFFCNSSQLDLIARARSFGLNPQPISLLKTTALSGKRIVITGTLSISRDEWKQKLLQCGVIVSSKVSRNTDCLLVGDNPGSKKEQAKKLDIPIYNEYQIIDLLNSPGETNSIPTENRS